MGVSYSGQAPWVEVVSSFYGAQARVAGRHSRWGFE